MNGLEMVRGFIDRGFTPYQAAALAGHYLQESGGNPNSLNKDEGAFGIGQWRLDRRENLENFAKAQGKTANDPGVQMDFVRHEMNGAEAKAGKGFMASGDVRSASAALRPYIRFGDDSADTRLSNAQNLYRQFNGGEAAPVGALATGTPAAASPAAAPVAPPTAVGALASAADPLKALSDKMTGGGQKQEDFAPLQQIQMPQANTGQSAQIAAALAKAYGIGV